MNQVQPETTVEPRVSEKSVFNVGTALALAVVVSLLAFLATSSGESPVVTAQAEPAEEAETAPAIVAESENEDQGGTVFDEAPAQAQPTTVAAAPPIGPFGVDAAFSSRSAIASVASEITDMGPTEVWFAANFPRADYTWERIVLTDGAQGDVAWLGEFGGRLIAASSNWTEDGRYTLMTHASTDGLSWQTLGTFDLAENGYVSRITSDGERLYAFAETWVEPDGNRNVLYTSTDGVSWNESALDLDRDDADYVYIQAAAAGPAGLAIAASFESYPGEQPVTLEFDDVNVLLDYLHSTYQILDAVSGEELLAGPLDEVFNWHDDGGQTIWDPETGEVIVVIPYEVWDQAYSVYYGSGSPLPIPVSAASEKQDGVISIEYDGYTITIDEIGYSYEVVDSTGAEVVSGPLDDIYQGLPPQFVDPDTGEVLLAVTWDEWRQAEEMGYRSMQPVEDEYTSRTELLWSPDGGDWTSVTLSGQYGANVSTLVPTDTGFVALVSSYGEFGDRRSVWTLEDGEWSSAEGEHSDLWLYQVAMASSGFLGVGDSGGGPALWSSSDGVTWDSEFTIVVQSDGSYASFADVAADEDDNVAALVRREFWGEYKPLVIEKDGYVLTFEDGETLLTVTDGSGATVLSLTWLDFDNYGASDAVTWEDGTTYIDLGNGDVVAIPDDEAYAAMEERWNSEGLLGLSVFLRENGQWSEAIVEADGGLNGASQVYLLDGKVIIAGSNWSYAETSVYDGPGASEFVIIVGTPAR